MPLKASYAASLTCTILRCWLMAVATLATFSEAVVSRCPDGQFFSTSARSCLACALCPKNLIIRVPCSPHSDTICGPFFEFYEFHQAPRPTLHDSDFIQDKGSHSQHNVDSDHSPHVTHRASHATDGEQSEEESLPPGESVARSPTHDDSGGQGTRDFQDLEYLLPGEGKAGDEGSASWEGSLDRPRVQTPEEERQWKVLALALIIVLCVFCIMLVLFIFIVCYFRASRSHRRKAALWSSAAPADCRGGERRRGAGAGGAPRYFPLPVWAHTQGAASPPPGERSHTAGMTTSGDRPEMVADRGTAGSEYVYFKSPQNGNGEAVDV